MWKKVLLGCGILTVVAVIGLGVLIYSLSRMVASQIKVPAALAKPGVLTGSALMSPSVLAQPAGVGMITDLAYSGSGKLTAVGDEGNADIDITTGNILNQTTWSTRQANVVAVTTPSGVTEYLTQGNWSTKAALMDSHGRTLWTYGGGAGVDDAAAGDIDGDGKLEFAVGFNGGGGIHLIDSTGKKIWRMDGSNIWHVDMVDTNGDGKLEVVHSDAGGTMFIRDASGRVLDQHRPAVYFSDFSVCRWPTRTGNQCILGAAKDAVYVLGFDGKTVARLNAPHNMQISTTRGTPLNPGNGKPDYFAVLTTLKTQSTSVLYVYDQKHKLVYQEVMPGAFSSIIALPGNGSQPESLLLGGDGIILRYEIIATSSKS